MDDAGAQDARSIYSFGRSSRALVATESLCDVLRGDLETPESDESARMRTLTP